MMSNKVAITKMNGITLIKKKYIIINCYVDISISKKWYLGDLVGVVLGELVATVYASNSSVIATYKITIDYDLVIKQKCQNILLRPCVCYEWYPTVDWSKFQAVESIR